MLVTIQDNEGLDDFNQEQWDKFVSSLANQENAELREVEDESKKSKKQNIGILEKYFHDRTLQPLSDFPEVKKKEVGCGSGFQGEHRYSDDEKDKATFMVKSVLNRMLT